MRFGIHMPQKADLQGMCSAQQRLLPILQIFVGNPTGWNLPQLDSGRRKARRLLHEHDIYPLVVHAAYLINLAAKKKSFIINLACCCREPWRTSAPGSPYVVLHVGSHGGRGYREGMELFISTLEAEMPNWPSGVELLLENTAGGGTSLGGTFISVGNILKTLGSDAPLGVCLDTAHAWAAGYDLSTPEGMERAMDELCEHVGMERVKVIHANDTATPRGTHRDRHSHLGEGSIGEDGFTAFSISVAGRYPCHTGNPEMGSRWDAVNMDRLRFYAGEQEFKRGEKMSKKSALCLPAMRV